MKESWFRKNAGNLIVVGILLLLVGMLVAICIEDINEASAAEQRCREAGYDGVHVGPFTSAKKCYKLSPEERIAQGK